jgi:N-methylhydantoinase A
VKRFTVGFCRCGMRIGIDVGGTFTDVILADPIGGQLWTTKVPTTPHEPVIGALMGVRQILGKNGFSGPDIGFVGHGTTIATNMIVEGKGAASALVTTKGFRDILEIRRAGRQDRADLYDLFFENPPPLVPRHHRFELDERMRHNGEVEIALTDEAQEVLVAQLREANVASVAICLLHAYVNPAHEMALLKTLRAAFPDRFICASYQINPEIMEYERTSTTVINAQLGPRCSAYIRGFETELRDTGVAGDLLFMQSNGGLATPEATSVKPVNLLKSGPAGGVTAAAQLCARLGIKAAITGDMGGTTFDVSLIRDGRAEIRTTNSLATHVVRAPTIDIESIGAGGGSIASVDISGGLHVGPKSAAADPGPACYGRGGTFATVTDCNLLLGHIDGTRFIGGDFALDIEAARECVVREIAQPLGLDVVAAARAVRTIANANMAQAMRLMTIGRGYDPREFVYICFGGGGPVHAIDIAEMLEIRRVIVPALPGLFSAFGMIIADQRYDVQSTILKNTSLLQKNDVARFLADLQGQMDRELIGAKVARGAVKISATADCRYIGQADSLRLDIGLDADPHQIEQAFEAAHFHHWNFVEKGRAIQVVSLQLTALLKTAPIQPGLATRSDKAPAPLRQRSICLEAAFEPVNVFLRRDLSIGAEVFGPAIIEEDNSSFVLKRGWRAHIDAERNIIAQREEGSRA